MTRLNAETSLWELKYVYCLVQWLWYLVNCNTDCIATVCKLSAWCRAQVLRVVGLELRAVEWKRNLVAHGDAREKWRGKRRMKWVASSLQLDSEQSIQRYYNRSLPTRTPRKPVLDWTDTSADINGLVRFTGRPNLVSALVPSHSIFTLLTHATLNTKEGRYDISFPPQLHAFNLEAMLYIMQPLYQIKIIRK